MLNLNLSSLLEKFRHLKNPREERERLVATIIECLGFEIPFDSVGLKADILYINVSGYMKTEIFIKKEFLLETLKTKGFKVGDVR